MKPKGDKRLLIFVTAFSAEGTPQLALQLARFWRHAGVNVEVVRLRKFPEDLQADFEGLGIPIHSLDLGTGLLRYLKLIWFSHSLARQRQPSAVLSFPLGWHACIAIGARAAGVRKVCAHAGNLPPVWAGSTFAKFKFLVQLGRPFTDKIICCSRYVLEASLRDFKLRPSEVVCVPNACDLKRITAAYGDRSRDSTLPQRLGVVGRLDANRDYESVIRAVSTLSSQSIIVEAWFVGDGSHREHLEALARTLEVSDRVRFLGVRRDVPELLQQLGLFVWPALPVEGFGIALAEAMAAGVPIVATDVGACREVLDGGRCGLLVEPGSPDALAAGIREVLEDPQGAQQRALAARERAQRHFSIEAMAQAYGQELGL